MTVLWMVIFLALHGIGFYIAAYTDEGEVEREEAAEKKHDRPP